jgi:hypothetical protein
VALLSLAYLWQKLALVVVGKLDELVKAASAPGVTLVRVEERRRDAAVDVDVVQADAAEPTAAALDDRLQSLACGVPDGAPRRAGGIMVNEARD